MSNRWYTQFFGTLHKKPVMMDCNFIVDPANLNGLGVSSLKGAGISNVFMNTTASFVGDTHTNTVIDGIASTANLKVGMIISGAGIVAGTKISSITSATAIVVNPATSATASGVTINYQGISLGAVNPNPLAGYILVQFQDNFNFYYFGTSQFEAPQTGTNILLTAGTLVVGTPYVISVVGTTTAAQWQAVGLPIGLTPAVGEAFFATATTGVGTGAVQASATSVAANIQVVGDPNQTIGANYVGASKLGGASSGAYMILKSLNGAGAVTAPASGTTVYLSFFMSNSFIQVNGS